MIGLIFVKAEGKLHSPPRLRFRLGMPEVGLRETIRCGEDLQALIGQVRIGYDPPQPALRILSRLEAIQRTTLKIFTEIGGFSPPEGRAHGKKDRR